MTVQIQNGCFVRNISVICIIYFPNQEGCWIHYLWNGIWMQNTWHTKGNRWM